MTDVVVIGAGHNGLVAACYLAQGGLDVLVLEARSIAGGMSYTEYSIPGAPHHAVHPCAVDLLLIRSSTILEDLRLADTGLRTVDIDPGYVYLDPGGASIALWRDQRRTAQEIGRLSKRDAAAYLRLCEELDLALRLGLPFLGENPARPPLASVAEAARNAVKGVRSLRGAISILTAAPERTVAERFEHPVVQDLLASIIGHGGSLTSASAAPGFLLLPFIHRFGTGRPIGGMSALIDALAERLRRSGGRLRTGAAVADIIVRHGAATGVRLITGEEIATRVGIVAACDPRVTLDRLLRPEVLPARVQRRVSRLPANADGTGDLKVDVALSGKVRLTRYEKERNDGVDLRIPTAIVGGMADITEAYRLIPAGGLGEPIPAWMLIPNAADPSQAPAGQDTVYLWSGAVPLHPAEGLDAYKERAGKTFVATADVYFEGLASLEIGRRVDTSRDMAQRYNVTNGCIGHVDWELRRLGPGRPAAGLGGYRTPVRSLYLSGAGTHPGAGVSGYPGHNAARVLLRDLRKRR